MTTLTKTDIATYTVDPAHSRVGFSVRHMGFARVRGSFEEFEGEVGLAEGDLSTLETKATIRAASITTNAPDRDKHLRSADFFEVETYPEITFHSREVKSVDGDSFVLVGDFTLHGVTETIELKGTYLGGGKDPWGKRRVGFEASARINRKNFGLNWNTALETGGFLVGDEVEISLEIQAVEG